MTVLVSSSPPPIPLRVRYIPVMLHFTLLVRTVTAAHHYGTAWANFNGCHRQQEKMLACQRKQRPGAKKDGLPLRRVEWQQWHLSWGLTKISFKVITQAKTKKNVFSHVIKSWQINLFIRYKNIINTKMYLNVQKYIYTSTLFFLWLCLQRLGPYSSAVFTIYL